MTSKKLNYNSPICREAKDTSSCPRVKTALYFHPGNTGIYLLPCRMVCIIVGSLQSPVYLRLRLRLLLMPAHACGIRQYLITVPVIHMDGGTRPFGLPETGDACPVRPLCFIGDMQPMVLFPAHEIPICLHTVLVICRSVLLAQQFHIANLLLEHIHKICPIVQSHHPGSRWK